MMDGEIKEWVSLASNFDLALSTVMARTLIIRSTPAFRRPAGFTAVVSLLCFHNIDLPSSSFDAFHPFLQSLLLWSPKTNGFKIGSSLLESFSCFLGCSNWRDAVLSPFEHANLPARRSPQDPSRKFYNLPLLMLLIYFL